MKKNKYIPAFIIIIVLLFSSIGLYYMYPQINQNAQESNNNRAINHYICDQSKKYNYVIDKKLKNIDYNQYLHLSGKETEYLQQQHKSFIKDFQFYETELAKENVLYYYAIDIKSNKTLTNSSDSLIDIQTDKKLQSKYQYYFQIAFDEQGQPSVNLQSETLDKNFSTYMSDDDLYSYEETDDDGVIQSELSMSSPKNIIITYAVPFHPAVNDTLTNYLNTTYTDQIILYMIPYIMIGCIIVVITMLVMPFHKIKNYKFFHFISNIKFEILSLIWIFLMYIISYALLDFVTITMSNDILEFYELFAIEYMEPILTPLTHVGLWFIFFLLIAIFIYMIKYLFHKGIKAYFIENTCLSWLYRSCKNLVNKILSIDFDNNIHRTVLKITLLNCGMMILLCILLGVTPLIAFVYSLIVFIILKKKFEETKDHYEVILKFTQQLSNGHFDYEINEDIGMFNPLKNELSHIKDGFEKAVNEEVKAQKMKTELISNVSHDLKTPLTSIITYVDLLKDQNLTVQQRNEYVHILERNSLKLKNLIEDLFEVSKANSGNIKLDIVNVDIISMIKQVELEYHDQFIHMGLDIRSQYPQNKIICALDSSKTYRIFENLFINISKYALKNTRVYIEVIDDDEYVKIIFKNISKEEMTFNENDIVERFVQGDKSRNTSGSGLGLAIVKSFTELQNGTFTVQLDGDLFKTIITFKK